MGQSLVEIAQTLKDSDKKVQLIYAFNGTGKTRLSRIFRLLAAPKDIEDEDNPGMKVLYYNAFTEDLFYWDNDLDADVNRKLIIRPNGFTNMVLVFLKDQGLDGNIISNFQHYTSEKLTPRFNEEYSTIDKDNRELIIKAYSEISFSIEAGNQESIENIKISKAEESNLIWCVFYSLLEQVVEILNISEPENRSTNKFDDLKYVFIDDPVSSLDDNHLIELAVNLASLIKNSTGLQFIISTHNPLFYNVLFNELNNAKRYRLEIFDDGTYALQNQLKDSPFSYHLFLLSELQKAIQSEGSIKKYHFNFLRNILEKTSTFLGYEEWRNLLPNEAEGSREGYYNRIINLSSHSKFSGEEVSDLTKQEKGVLKHLVEEIIATYKFKEISNDNIIEGNGSI